VFAGGKPRAGPATACRSIRVANIRDIDLCTGEYPRERDGEKEGLGGEA